MTRSRRHRDAIAPSLFPFLAVLLCTMGSLVLILMLIVAGAQASTRRVTQAVEEEIEFRTAAVELKEKSLQKDLEESRIEVEKKRLALQHVENHIQDTLDELDELQKKKKLLEEETASGSDEEQERKLTELERQLAEAKEQMKTVTKRYADMIEGVKERMAALEEKSEEELTSRDEQMLKTLPKQLEMYEQTAARMEQTYSRIYSPEALLQRKLGVTSLAATNKDVFITTNAIEGRGYEVWRLDHELSSPKQIMTGLGGCCGQCDVQAAGDNIVIGENTRFQVSLVDRDGNRLSSFGKRDRSSVDGFGSCCNPMNVTCCSNGDIITSESTVGNIKRFSAKGEYLGLVGKAAISGGCKHVAVSFDEKRNRYYTMNIDKGHICVLAANPEPSAEASESEAEISEALPVPARRSQAVQTISIEIEK